MFLKNIKNNKYFHILFFTLILLLFISILIFVMESIHLTSETNKNSFAYTVKVSDTIEEIDKIFERAEVNLHVFADTIANSYDTERQQDKNYNLNYIKSIDGLVKAVLANSPSVNGTWFQVNADLPFSVSAYNWYEFKDDDFVNLKAQFEEDSLKERQITPEDDPYYFDAVNNKKTTWSDIYVDPDTKVPMMTVSQPVYSDDMLIGVVGIDISTDNLQQALRNMQLVFYTSELFLLDQKNNVIISQLLYRTPNGKNDYPFLKLFNESKYGDKLVEYNESGIKKTAIMLSLSNKDKLVITFKDMHLFVGLDNLFNTLYFIVVILIALAIMILISRDEILGILEKAQNKKQEEAETEGKTEEELEKSESQ